MNKSYSNPYKHTEINSQLKAYKLAMRALDDEFNRLWHEYDWNGQATERQRQIIQNYADASELLGREINEIESEMELPDNRSICSACGGQANDDTDTVFDEHADPYHKNCLMNEREKRE